MKRERERDERDERERSVDRLSSIDLRSRELQTDLFKLSFFVGFWFFVLKRTTASPFYAQGLRGEILDVCYDHYGLRAAVCSSQAIAVRTLSHVLFLQSFLVLE